MLGYQIRTVTAADELTAYQARKQHSHLSPMETRLYDAFVHSGWSAAKLAAEFGISVGTVKVYFTRILHHYRVRSRSELIANALWPRIRSVEADLREATRLLNIHTADAENRAKDQTKEQAA